LAYPIVIRLKTRPQFQAVLAGRTLSRTPHFVLHCGLLDTPVSADQRSLPSAVSMPLFPRRGVWLGAMVPKRWAKRAVTRNAIKRQIYNVSAQYESTLLEGAHVVRLRSAFDPAHFASASSDVLKAAVRAELMQLFERTAQSASLER